MKKTILLFVFALILCFTYGQTFEWAKAMGGHEGDSGYSIATDALGNVYTTGYFQDTVDFDPSVGVFTLSTINMAAFIVKLDAAGNFVWAKKLAGSLSGANYS